jgi:hypothetical protein
MRVEDKLPAHSGNTASLYDRMNYASPDPFRFIHSVTVSSVPSVVAVHPTTYQALLTLENVGISSATCKEDELPVCSVANQNIASLFDRICYASPDQSRSNLLVPRQIVTSIPSVVAVPPLILEPQILPDTTVDIPSLRKRREAKMKRSLPRLNSFLLEPYVPGTQLSRQNSVHIEPSEKVFVKYTVNPGPGIRTGRPNNAGLKLQRIISAQEVAHGVFVSDQEITHGKLSKLMDIMSKVGLEEYGVPVYSSADFFRMTSNQQRSYSADAFNIVRAAMQPVVFADFQSWFVQRCNHLSKDVREWASTDPSVAAMLLENVHFCPDGLLVYKPDATPPTLLIMTAYEQLIVCNTPKSAKRGCVSFHGK